MFLYHTWGSLTLVLHWIQVWKSKRSHNSIEMLTFINMPLCIFLPIRTSYTSCMCRSVVSCICFLWVCFYNFTCASTDCSALLESFQRLNICAAHLTSIAHLVCTLSLNWLISWHIETLLNLSHDHRDVVRFQDNADHCIYKQTDWRFQIVSQLASKITTNTYRKPLALCSGKNNLIVTSPKMSCSSN